MTTTTQATTGGTHAGPVLFYARLVLCALVLLLIAQGVRAAGPNLTPIVSGPTTATVGKSFRYTVQVTNVGAASTKGSVTITDALHPSLAINSVSTDSPMFACKLDGQTVACATKSPIPAGSTGVGVASIDVTPLSAGAVDNRATVSGGGDANSADNSTVPITTTVAAPVDVAGPGDAGSQQPIPALGAPMLALLAGVLAGAGMLATKGRALRS